MYELTQNSSDNLNLQAYGVRRGQKFSKQVIHKSLIYSGLFEVCIPLTKLLDMSLIFFKAVQTNLGIRFPDVSCSRTDPRRSPGVPRHGNSERARGYTYE